MSIGERLRLARNKAGLSQPEMATILNCTKGTIINWEAEKNDIPSTALIKYAEICRVHPNWLLTGKESAQVSNSIQNSTGDTLQNVSGGMVYNDSSERKEAIYEKLISNLETLVKMQQQRIEELEKKLKE